MRPWLPRRSPSVVSSWAKLICTRGAVRRREN
jgi:hypothetical protein